VGECDGRDVHVCMV